MYRRALTRLGIAAVGLSAGLATAEAVLRLSTGYPLLPLVPPIPYLDNGLLYQRTPRRLYELRPGVDATVGRWQVHIHTNAAGFRDDVDYALAKPGGTQRIVVLGDSFTFGGKVALESTLPKVVAARLDAADPAMRHEVLNLSVPGYNSEQEALMLEEKGLAFEPDLVLVAFVLNDAGAMAQLVPAREPRFPALHTLLKRFDLVQFLYGGYKQIDAARRSGREIGSTSDPDFTAGAPRWAITRDALAQIEALASSHGARTLVMVWPMLVDLGDRYPFLAKHELVSTTCRELGIPVLDLLPRFLGRDAATLWADPRDHHPNAEAQRIAGDAVADAIVSAGFLKKGGGS